LVQRAQIIVSLPLLNYLAILEAVDGDAFKLHLSASGRAKLLCLSLVGAAYGVAAYHLVPFGYHILDAYVDVGEGFEERGYELFGLLLASDVSIRFVPHELGRVELFDELWVPLADDLPRTKCQGPVLFGRHSSTPFLSRFI
jgi:hypothetical protein